MTTPKLTRQNVQEIRQLWTTGQGSTYQLGTRFHVSGTTIWKIVNNLTWHDPHYTPPVKPPHGMVSGGRGAANGNARLTWEQVHLIRHRYATGGITQTQLAAEYGVQKMTLSEIIRNVAWRDPNYTPPKPKR